LGLFKVKINVCVKITEFLRTAYRPFAYCVPSQSPLNTAYQKGGGVTLIVLDCLQYFLDGSWKASLYSKQKWCFPLLFSTLSTYSNYLRKINKTKTLYNIFICVIFVIHPLKIQRTVPTASTVHVCHWVLITAVKLLKIDFTSDTTVQTQSSHCKGVY